MGKHKPKTASDPGWPLTDDFWADHVNKVMMIQVNWLKTYGHLFSYRKQDSTTRAASGTEYPMHGHGRAEQGAPRDRQVSRNEPIAYLGSRLKEEARPVVTEPRRCEYPEYNIPSHEYRKICQCADGRYGYQHPSGYSSPYESWKTPQSAGIKYGQRPYVCHEIPQLAGHVLAHPSSSLYGSQKVPQSALVQLGAPMSFCGCDPLCASQKCTESWHNSLQNRKGTCDYSTPGYTQQHHIVRDPVTSYSTSFGHHSYQLKQQNPGNCSGAKMYNSHSVTQNHKNPSDDLLRPTYLQNNDKSHLKMESSSSQPDLQVYRPKGGFVSCGHVCSRSNSLTHLPDDPLRCPKCHCWDYCVCVPRRHQIAPQGKGIGPEEILPSWSPQPWLGVAYSGDRKFGVNDVAREHCRLRRDPESKTTSMNRLYDDLKKRSYCTGELCHSDPDSFLCPVCKVDYDAERRPWFQEQLRKGNPFTTGDTQFKACSYSPAI